MNNKILVPKQQRGIALITILVMVALASIIAATIVKRQYLTADNTAYLMRQNQALQYSKSAEYFLSELLVQDAKNSPEADYLQETWAQPLPPFPVDGGVVSGRVEDLSGKFNLNSLLKANGEPNEKTRKIFENLLVRVGLPAELSQSVIDWQDPDDQTSGSMGAESQYYQGLGQSYLPPSRMFSHIDELKLVRGFEGANYNRIAAYISALPVIDSKININTAPALILASLDKSLDVNAVQQMLKAKQAKFEHFSTLAGLLDQDLFSRLSPESKTLANDVFDVKSAFFKAQIEVVFGERKRQMSSYLMRKNQQVFVYSRSLVPF